MVRLTPKQSMAMELESPTSPRPPTEGTASDGDYDHHSRSPRGRTCISDVVHAPLYRDAAARIGSLNFAPLYNEMHNQERASVGIGFSVLSAILPLLLGAITALAASLVGLGSEWLADARVDMTLEQFHRGAPVIVIWLKHMGAMAALALAGGLPVICCVNSAGSSGIPSVIGLLNGCDLRLHFTVRSLLVKLVGVIFSVSSGLAAGPEGPMIFVGACVGALLAKILSHPLVWRYLGTPPGTLNEDVYLRDYVSTGAGCGIAAAFKAPIAGTLFVIEEAASHFQRDHLATVFFAGIVSLEVILLLTNGKGILEYEVPTGSGCDQWSPWNFVFFALIGLVCGFTGSVFNTINVAASKFRARRANPNQRCRRLLDLLALIAITSATFVFLPVIFGDREVHASEILARSTGCIADELKDQLFLGSGMMYNTLDDFAGEYASVRGMPEVAKGARRASAAGARAPRSSSSGVAGAPPTEAAQQRLPSGLRQVRHRGAVLKYAPQPCLYGMQYDRILCPQVNALAQSNDSTADGRAFARVCSQDLIRGTALEGRPDAEAYCCAFDSISDLAQGRFQVPANASCPLDLGRTMPQLWAELEAPVIGASGEALFEDGGRNRTLEGDIRDDGAFWGRVLSYNPMAALSLVPLDSAAQNLFSRGVPYVLPLPVLLAFIPAFFLLAAVTAGSAVPSGLLLPQIVCGAAIGRALTLVAIGLQAKVGLFWQVSSTSSIWSPVYQPLFASAGGPLPDDAAMSTGGFLDPGVGALVGAAAFLGGSGRITLFTTVMMVEITGDPTMILPVGTATMIAVFVGNKFNRGLYHALVDVQSFPYLPDHWPAKRLPRSLRVRDALKEDCDVVTVPLSGGLEEVDMALEGNEYNGYPVVDDYGVVVGVAERRHLVALLSGNREADVGSVTDFHTITVRPSLPLEVAYQLFKRMEMRHLVVVDDGHLPKAVLTRGSLLPWLVEERVGGAAAGDAVIRRPREFRDFMRQSSITPPASIIGHIWGSMRSTTP